MRTRSLLEVLADVRAIAGRGGPRRNAVRSRTLRECGRRRRTRTIASSSLTPRISAPSASASLPAAPGARVVDELMARSVGAGASMRSLVRREPLVLHVPMTLEAGECQRHVAGRGPIQVRALRRIPEVIDRAQKGAALADVLGLYSTDHAGDFVTCTRALLSRSSNPKSLVRIASRIFWECASFIRISRPVAGVCAGASRPTRLSGRGASSVVKDSS